MSLPKKLLSIDIGSERIKIAYINKQKKKTIVLKSMILPTPKNAIKDGVLNNKEEISTVIQNALLTEKIKEKNVVFTISSSKIITREVELPYLKSSKLKNVVRMNAEEYFPVDLTDYCLDYTITDVIETEEGKKAKVIIFAAMTSIVDMYVELADMCKLKVVGVDYTGNSIVSFIKNENVEGTNLFIDIGAESTMVVIMHNNVVKFSRTIMFGTKIVNDSIMNHFEVDYEEATKISKERQLLNFDNNENTYLTNDVSSGMEQILGGVSRLVDYYSSRNKNQVEKVYLLGGGSEIYGINEYVEKFFNLKVARLEESKKLANKGSGDKLYNIAYFAAVFGATTETINLLPQHIKNREANRARQRIPYLLVLLVIVALGALYYSQFVEFNKLKNQKSDIEFEIESMKDIEEIKVSYEEMSEKQAFREELESLSTNRSDYLIDLIEGLEKTMPDKVFITSLADSEVSINFEVTALDEASVAQLLTYLKNIEGGVIEDEPYKLFSSVYTGSITRVGDVDQEASYVTCSIVCTYYEPVTEVEVSQ